MHTHYRYKSYNELKIKLRKWTQKELPLAHFSFNCWVVTKINLIQKNVTQ